MELLLLSQNMSDLLDLKDIFGDQNHSQNFINKYHKLISSTKIALLIIIIVIGLIGNTFNMIVFSRRNMRNVSTFRFLMYLAAFDLLVLSTGTTHLLLKQLFHFDLRIYSNLVCKLHTFFTYLTTHVSSLILTTVSIDRAIKIKNLTRSKPRKTSDRFSSFSASTRKKIIFDLNDKEKISDSLALEYESGGVTKHLTRKVNLKVKFSVQSDSIKLENSNSKSGLGNAKKSKLIISILGLCIFSHKNE